MGKNYAVLLFLVVSCVFVSCRQSVSEHAEGYGIVYINVADAGMHKRAIDANGLPSIADAKITLKLNSPSKGNEKIEFEAGTPKIWSGVFPIGETIYFTVTLRTPFAEWEGSKEYTVNKKTDTVYVKLDKKAVRLEKLLFSSVRENQLYNLTLKVQGAPAISTGTNIKSIIAPQFCRDNKARIFLAYIKNDGKGIIERYTSEGNKDKAVNISLSNSEKICLAADYATGKMYAGVKSEGRSALYRVNDDGTHELLVLPDTPSIAGIDKIAVHNNIAVVYSHGNGLIMYRIEGKNISFIGAYSDGNLKADTTVALDTDTNAVGTVNDLYMVNDVLYVLFSAFSKDSVRYYSLGGMVKYTYGTDGTITLGKKIGINRSYAVEQADSTKVFKTEDTACYGPVKVIGFDKDAIYIADDGVSFKKTDTAVVVAANKDRIITLNRKSDAISFDNAPENTKWLTDETVTQTGNVNININIGFKND